LPVSDIDRHLGARIAEARRELGLTHQKLGALIESDPEQIEAMEEGRLRVSSLVLARISRCVDKPLSWFFAGLPGQEIFESGLRTARSV